MWGATWSPLTPQRVLTDFNPRAPCGARLKEVYFLWQPNLISIHAPRVGRDITDPFLRAPDGISIHAPRVGRDHLITDYAVYSDISIHAPRVGRDIWLPSIPKSWGRFQSTRPVWGATPFPTSLTSAIVISIHAPRVGRDDIAEGDYKNHFAISIHAPRVGRDWTTRGFRRAVARFQSTRPVWGATFIFHPHEIPWKQFQSTRPVWGATIQTNSFNRILKFQSTRPVWGATANLTILPRQICTKGTKEFLLGRKTHGKKEK